MKIKKKLLLVSVLFIVICLSSLSTSAKEINNENNRELDQYYFAVPSIYTEIEILKDGSIEFYYRFEFYNTPSQGQTIDIVDVGFPNVYYDLSSVRAWLNGTEITSIYESEYVEIGVEIHLGSSSIQGGQTGILEVVCTNPKMVYKDSEAGLASVVFFQTWFWSQFTEGFTSRVVRFYFPEVLKIIVDLLFLWMI